MKPTAYMYTCRNLGQVALMWPGQPAPTGPGWIDVKAEPLVRLSEVEVLREGLVAALGELKEMKKSIGFRGHTLTVITQVEELLK